MGLLIVLGFSRVSSRVRVGVPLVVPSCRASYHNPAPSIGIRVMTRVRHHTISPGSLAQMHRSYSKIDLAIRRGAPRAVPMAETSL